MRTTVNASIHVLTDEVPTMKLEADGQRLVIEDLPGGKAHFALSMVGGPAQRREVAEKLRQIADSIDQWAALT